MKYYLIAGEASGDLHASRLMHEIKQQDAQAEFRYYGGDAMRQEGGVLVRHYRQLAYMGFYQVVTHLRTILSGMSQCKADIAAFRPDALILVDYPGFNLGIAKWARKHLSGCKTVYYISPKIWAWKSWRLKAIRRDVDLMLSILPFEVEWYRTRGYEVNYVGNPTVDELYALRNAGSAGEAKESVSKVLEVSKGSKESISKSLEIVSETKIGVQKDLESFILLVPGSRRAEVSDNLRVMLEATRGFSQTLPDGSQRPYQRIIAGAPGLDSKFYAEVLDRLPDAADVQVRFGQTHQLMAHAHVAAVTSGTATLEAAYLRCPQVVCYNFKGGMLFYNVMKVALKSIRYVSLVNLLIYGITGDKSLPDERHAAVCELLGPYLTPQTLRAEMQKLLPVDSEVRQQMLANYDHMAQVLGEPGAPKRAAEAIGKLIIIDNYFESQFLEHSTIEQSKITIK